MSEFLKLNMDLPDDVKKVIQGGAIEDIAIKVSCKVSFG